MNFSRFNHNLSMREICETLFLQNSNGIAVIDSCLNIKMFNGALLRLLGYNEGELLNCPIENIFAVDSRRNISHQITERIKRVDAAANVETCLVDKNGACIRVTMAVYGYNQTSAGSMAVMVVNEIRDRRCVGNDFYASRDQMKQMIEHLPAAVAMFDTEMRYIAHSRKWLADYHLDEQYLIGKSHYDIFPEIGEDLKQIHRRGLSGEYFPVTEAKFERHDGTVDWVEWEQCPWYSEENKISGIILFTQVVTARKNAEEKVRRANEILETKVAERTAELQKALDREKRINELKSRFVSTASHEFRTPLGSIQSSADLLQVYLNPETESKTQKHLLRIKSGVRHLTQLLDDFLSLDKLENNKVKAVFLPVNVQKLLSEVCETMSGMLKKGQYISSDYHGNADVVLDENLFRNILYNLISNASKFSHEGAEIKVEVSLTETDLVLVVSDYGIGIPAEEHDMMFSRLFRARNAANISGTGLGLNIVKKYVGLLNGEITFKSEENSGSVFTVRCPIVRSQGLH